MMEISIGTGYRPYPFNVNVDTSHDGAIHSIKPLDSFDSDAGTTAEHEPPKRQRKPCRRNPTPRTVTTVPPAAGPPRGATASGARRVGAGRGVKGCASAILARAHGATGVSVEKGRRLNRHTRKVSVACNHIIQNHKFTCSTQRAWIPNGTGVAIAWTEVWPTQPAIHRPLIGRRYQCDHAPAPRTRCLTAHAHPPRVAPACPDDPRSSPEAACGGCECLRAAVK